MAHSPSHGSSADTADTETDILLSVDEQGELQAGPSSQRQHPLTQAAEAESTTRGKEKYHIGLFRA